LFDLKLLPVFKPTVKTIAVGNLSTGGTGKSPHVEYLIKLLSDKYFVATLSRGYGRKTSGFKLADEKDNADSIGDEPTQYNQKFKHIAVAVDGNRTRGIRKLLSVFPNLKVILLDDALQHRSVEAGLTIMLTDYANMFYSDYVLPTGSLREFRSGYKRADVIVVTKTPAVFSPIERRHILSQIHASAHQQVFCSYIKYSSITHFFNKQVYDERFLNEVLNKETSVLLFAGIANPALLEDLVRDKSKSYQMLVFKDHYRYTEEDLEKIKQQFDEMKASKKIILTTEKDAMRLLQLNLLNKWQDLPLFFISIAVQMHAQDEEKFNQLINNYVGTN
jgi:tetraacyldisaccharide 4'-kinase